MWLKMLQRFWFSRLRNFRQQLWCKWVSDNRCLSGGYYRNAQHTSALRCVKWLSLSLQWSLQIHITVRLMLLFFVFYFFFENPSGFVSVNCLSLSPLKMIDGAWKTLRPAVGTNSSRRFWKELENGPSLIKRPVVCVDNVWRYHISNIELVLPFL